jgi:hypothetical protein
MFSYTIKELLWLNVETVMHCLLHFAIICNSATSQNLLQECEQTKLRRCKVCTVWWVVKRFKFQFLKGFLGIGNRIMTGIIVAPTGSQVSVLPDVSIPACVMEVPCSFHAGQKRFIIYSVSEHVMQTLFSVSLVNNNA